MNIQGLGGSNNPLEMIQKLSKREDLDYELLKKLFSIRSINLEEIEVKLLKEKDGYFVQEHNNNGCHSE